jgi:triacylglycerol lipase
VSGLAPARRRLVLLLLGALIGVLVAGGGVLLVQRLSGDETAEQSRPGPVLLVSGYGGETAALEPLVDELRGQGREVAVLEPEDGGTGDLREQAKRLAALAEATMDKTGTESVDVVGYSAGGVVARLYVREEGGASAVRRVLTLGSPHHGAEVAATAADVAGGCPEACEQLAIGSDLLRRLNAGDETPAGPRWVTVRTSGDRTVTPIESAMLDGATNIEVHEVCPDSTATHGTLPGDPVVLATLRSALGAKAPSVPDDVTC